MSSSPSMCHWCLGCLTSPRTKVRHRFSSQARSATSTPVAASSLTSRQTVQNKNLQVELRSGTVVRPTSQPVRIGLASIEVSRRILQSVAARTDSSISKRRSQLLEGGITDLRLLRTADVPLTRNFQKLFICRLSAIMGHARATQLLLCIGRVDRCP